MNDYSRKQFLAMTGLSAAALMGLSFSACSGVKRKDLADVLAEEGRKTLSERDREMLRLSSLAPSGHNAQPWTVRVRKDRWIIGSDESRWLPAVDPDNRELLLSIGAFIENLTIAAASMGLCAVTEITAASGRDRQLAAISFSKDTELAADAAPLVSRRIVRKGHRGKEISPADVRLLEKTCPGLVFVPRESAKGRYLAEATIEANRVQTWRDDAQQELARWIRFSRSSAEKFRNGLTPESMEITGFAGLVVRSFFDEKSVMGKSFREQGLAIVREQVAAHGGWLVLTGSGVSPAKLIDAGRRFERLALCVRSRSIALHPMTQILEEKPFCGEVQRELGLHDDIQFILRSGYLDAYPDPVSLRMPVEWFAS
jgi:hypothetical protein